jgi:DNA-binding response OmpR family regulator
MKKFHIAVVEDDLAFAAELEEFLGTAGYTVSIYDSSQKFLAALRQSECDLLIVDWSIPDLSGIEVLEYIRKFHPDMPAIMLTARSENIDIVRGLQAVSYTHLRAHETLS